ncbi:MAG: hypothetical protein BWX55_00787 [Deltaproteobacteria bacterium ADurb.Bin022]|nr:MAG: hypothetical protein BWX55_00787 [Deltaproteobacteria bacterium ADurb.Bin022]
MILFGRQVFAVNVEKFRAVQADIFSAVSDGGRNFFYKFYVTSDLNTVLIQADRGLPAVFEIFIVCGVVMAFLFLIPLEHVGIGIDHHHAGRAVDDQVIILMNKARDIIQPHNGRQLQRARDNGRMRGAPAAVRGKSQNFVQFHLRRIGR